MLLTVDNKKAATRLVENVENNPNAGGYVTPFPDAIRKRILNSTVRIYGTSKAGKSLFSGSGVIFLVDSKTTYILTAAHNIMMWAGLTDPPTNWSGYTSSFAQAMSIAYGKQDMTFDKTPTGKSASNKNSVDAPPDQTGACAARTPCLYDLLLIKSTDTNLRSYAQQYVFGGESFDDINSQVRGEASEVINHLGSLLYLGNHCHYVQLGYGKTQDARYIEWIDSNKIKQKEIKGYCEYGTNMHEYYLQYRLTTPCFSVTQSVYNQTAEAGDPPAYSEYTDAIWLLGRKSSTTASGDSGGPLYAVSKDMKTVYLLGVTTGADMKAAQTISKAFRNVISTSVKRYLKIRFPDL